MSNSVEIVGACSCMHVTGSMLVLYKDAHCSIGYVNIHIYNYPSSHFSRKKVVGGMAATLSSLDDRGWVRVFFVFTSKEVYMMKVVVGGWARR